MQRIPAIVLLADRVSNHSAASLSSADLEFADDEYFGDLLSGLQQIAPSVTHYDNIVGFIDRIEQHRDHLVISTWAGERSRNRRALVPAVCEAYGVAYVGADAYTGAVCQDKHLAKRLCADFGLATPAGVLIRGDADMDLLDTIRYPAVVKPNHQGGSIGIGADCLVASTGAAAGTVRRLLTAFGPPVIVEEFIRGREVSVVFAGSRKGVAVAEAVEITLSGSGPALADTIWSFEMKKQYSRSAAYASAAHLIDAVDMERCTRLFHALQKCEYLRIDGRVHDSGFTIIELSPDAYLGSDGAVAAAFQHRGAGYAEMLITLVRCAYENR